MITTLLYVSLGIIGIILSYTSKHFLKKCCPELFEEEN